MRAIVLSLIFVTMLTRADAAEALIYEPEPLSITIDGRALQWRIELADEQPERSRGLMFRRFMAVETGMLFRFDVSRPVMMWMKNTFIPLDMLFADGDGTITHIRRQTVPESLEVISSRGPVRYVLEINGGEAERLGLKVGQRMVHPAISQ